VEEAVLYYCQTNLFLVLTKKKASNSPVCHDVMTKE